MSGLWIVAVLVLSIGMYLIYDTQKSHEERLRHFDKEEKKRQNLEDSRT